MRQGQIHSICRSWVGLMLLTFLLLGTLCSCGSSQTAQAEEEVVTYDSLSEEGKAVVDYIFALESNWSSINISGETHTCTQVYFTTHDGIPALSCYYPDSPVFYQRYYSYDPDAKDFSELETTYIYGSLSPTGESPVTYNLRWDATKKKDELARQYASYLEKQNASD